MNVLYKTDPPQIDKYYELFLSTGWNEKFKLSKEELALALSCSYYTVSAYQNEKLVGFGRIVSDGILHAMIYEMIVDPACQRKGIGAQILKMLLEKCDSAGIRDVQLFCAKGKRVFYEKFGFQARPDDAPGMQYIRNK